MVLGRSSPVRAATSVAFTSSRAGRGAREWSAMTIKKNMNPLYG